MKCMSADHFEIREQIGIASEYRETVAASRSESKHRADEQAERVCG
jgi:hypothetical protein